MRPRLSLRLAWRHLQAGRDRVVLSILALALGVALVVAIDLMNAAVLDSFLDTVDGMAGRAALTVQADEAWRRERVLRHAARFRDGARSLGYTLLSSDTPIQPLVCGSETAALAASEALLAAGLWVPAIRPPTVPSGRSRLRITFSAAHDDTDVDRLLDTLAALRLPELRE